MNLENKTLKQVMPSEFDSCEYDKTRAYTMKDSLVLKEHCSFADQDEYQYWPGKHKNVFLWAELANGYLVGWNENPSRGWSFPVMRRPK